MMTETSEMEKACCKICILQQALLRFLFIQFFNQHGHKLKGCFVQLFDLFYQARKLCGEFVPLIKELLGRDL